MRPVRPQDQDEGDEKDQKPGGISSCDPQDIRQEFKDLGAIAGWKNGIERQENLMVDQLGAEQQGDDEKQQTQQDGLRPLGQKAHAKMDDCRCGTGKKVGMKESVIEEFWSCADPQDDFQEENGQKKKGQKIIALQRRYFSEVVFYGRQSKQWNQPPWSRGRWRSMSFDSLK